MQAQEVLSEHRCRNSKWWPHRLLSSERNTYKHFWGNKMQQNDGKWQKNWSLLSELAPGSSMVYYCLFNFNSVSSPYWVPRSSLYLSNCCEHGTLDLADSNPRKKCQRCQSWPPHRRCPQCAVLLFGRRPGELGKRSQERSRKHFKYCRSDMSHTTLTRQLGCMETRYSHSVLNDKQKNMFFKYENSMLFWSFQHHPISSQCHVPATLFSGLCG